MNCASVKMSASRSSRIARLFSLDLGFLVELVELELGRRLGAERDVNETGLAVERSIFLVAQDVGDAGVDAPLDLVGQAARDQFLAELNELLAVDGRFLVGEDEEADVVVRSRGFRSRRPRPSDRAPGSRARISTASRTSR
jgi:hypothetical protein